MLQSATSSLENIKAWPECNCFRKRVPLDNRQRITCIHLMNFGSMQVVPERIMSNALKEHDGKASIGGRTSTNLLLADDIDDFAEEE